MGTSTDKTDIASEEELETKYVDCSRVPEKYKRLIPPKTATRVRDYNFRVRQLQQLKDSSASEAD